MRSLYLFSVKDEESVPKVVHGASSMAPLSASVRRTRGMRSLGWPCMT